MKAQQPARGIAVIGEYPNAKNYHIECDCGSADHSVKMWIEINKDQDIPDVELSFYVTTWTENFWENWPARLQAVWDILFKGVHKQEHHMLLDKQSAFNLARTIERTVRELDK